MKKILLSLVAIIALSVNAQKKGDIQFGVKAGLNVSTVGDDYGDDFNAKAGFHIGGLVEIPIAKKFAIQPELVFSTQGAKSNGHYYRNNRHDATLRLNYINIPVLLKYNITKQFTVEGGPQVGIRVSSKIKGNDGTNKVNGFTAADLALTAGVSYRLENNVFFSARHNFGITNIIDNSYRGSAVNGVFQLSVGYKF